MRISDWSSDVCSSDLRSEEMSESSQYPTAPFGDWDGSPAAARAMQQSLAAQVSLQDDFPPLRLIAGVDVGFEDGGTITRAAEIGRESCRESERQYVCISVGAFCIKKKTHTIIQ